MAGNQGKETSCLFLGAVLLLLSLFGGRAVGAEPLDTWHVRSPFTPGSDLYGVTYANGLYVAVGNNGTLATSRDQVHWTTQALVSDAGVSEPCLFAVTYGGGLFVAVGTYIWSSPDGVTWTFRPCSAGPFGGVAYGNGRFVAAGGSGGYFNQSGPPGLATSEDGITWVDRSTTSGVTSEPTKALIFADGVFVQVAWHQPPYYSKDGLTWEPGASATGASLYNHGEDVAYGNGLFVVVGNYLDFGYGAAMVVSTFCIMAGFALLVYLPLRRLTHE